MSSKFTRKPVGNFFIKKSLQIGLIIRVIVAALISTVVSAGTLLLYYYLRYNTTAIYLWNQDSNDLQKTGHIINLVLPTLIISAIVCIALAFVIGLYASRKYAVPVYKIEQWVSMLLNGKMTAVLRFREHEEMKELTLKCNELGTSIRTTLLDIKKSVKSMQDAGIKNPELESVAAKLDEMELADPA